MQAKLPQVWEEVQQQAAEAAAAADAERAGMAAAQPEAPATPAAAGEQRAEEREKFQAVVASAVAQTLDGEEGGDVAVQAAVEAGRY